MTPTEDGRDSIDMLDGFERAAAFCPELTRFNRLELGDRLRIYRECRRLARGYRRGGEYDRDDVAAKICGQIATQDEYGSVLLIIGLAALAATVQFWVKRLWEKWFPND